MKQTKATKSFDRDNILQLVSKQAWQQLIEEFKDNDNYDTICSDGILKPLIDQYFINELLNSSTLNNDPAYKYYLEQCIFRFKLTPHSGETDPLFRIIDPPLVHCFA